MPWTRPIFTLKIQSTRFHLRAEGIRTYCIWHAFVVFVLYQHRLVTFLLLCSPIVIIIVAIFVFCVAVRACRFFAARRNEKLATDALKSGENSSSDVELEKLIGRVWHNKCMFQGLAIIQIPLKIGDVQLYFQVVAAIAQARCAAPAI